MNIHIEFEILNQNSNSTLLGQDPWIDWLFSLPWLSPVEEQQNLCKKGEEQSWKEEENEEQLREKEREEFDPKTCTTRF